MLLYLACLVKLLIKCFRIAADAGLRDCYWTSGFPAQYWRNQITFIKQRTAWKPLAV